MTSMENSNESTETLQRSDLNLVKFAGVYPKRKEADSNSSFIWIVLRISLGISFLVPRFVRSYRPLVAVLGNLYPF